MNSVKIICIKNSYSIELEIYNQKFEYVVTLHFDL